jgi:acetyltransferase-like isoleucine patch superfamily enzyme
MADYHDIHIGRYSYGACFDPAMIATGTRIGAYCSFASSVCVPAGNHPYRFKSTHPFFFNPHFGYVRRDLTDRTRLTVGNDVWVGYNAIILPSVSHVGDGAVVGAGAVVTKDVPAYAVVAGNPARVIRYRFSEETIAELKKSEWWRKSIEELWRDWDTFTGPFE